MNKKNIGHLLFILGIFIFLTPQWLIFYNGWTQGQRIRDYQTIFKTEDLVNIRERMNLYNQSLTHEASQLDDPFQSYTFHSMEKDLERFEVVDVIGYLHVPKIGEKLPIYMGATTEHLSQGVAVIESTSLPIGGRNTHSVIAGHRGYGYANYFRNIDDLEKGDHIYIYSYGEVLTYTVYMKEVILPTQTDKLGLIPDQDVITLLTCHPFLSNAYRLLVWAERTDEGVEVTDEVADEITEERVKETDFFEKTTVKAFIQYRLSNTIVVTFGTVLALVNIFILVKRIKRTKS